MPETDAVYDDLLLFYSEAVELCKELKIKDAQVLNLHRVVLRVADQMFSMCCQLEETDEKDLTERIQSIDIQATAILSRLRRMFNGTYDFSKDPLHSYVPFSKRELFLLKQPEHLQIILPAIVYLAAKIAVDNAYTIKEVVDNLHKIPYQEIDQSDEDYHVRIGRQLESSSYTDISPRITIGEIESMEYYLFMNMPGSLINTPTEVNELKERGEKILAVINEKRAAEAKVEDDNSLTLSPGTASTSLSQSPSMDSHASSPVKSPRPEPEQRKPKPGG